MHDDIYVEYNIALVSLFSVLPWLLRSECSLALLAALSAPSPTVLRVAYCCAASPEWLPGLNGLVGRVLPHWCWRRCCTFQGPSPQPCSADLAPLLPWCGSSFPGFVRSCPALNIHGARPPCLLHQAILLGMWCYARPGVHSLVIAPPDVPPVVRAAFFWPRSTVGPDIPRVTVSSAQNWYFSEQVCDQVFP